MSLMTLPEEVLEILFLYVGIEDVLTVCKVVGLEGSDSFWRKICKREHFKRVSKDDDCWKTVFYRNINWTTGKFVKREYKFDKYVRDLFDSDHFRSIYVKDVLQGENLIVKSGEDEISIWNIDKHPVLIKTLPAHFVRVSRSKLLVHYKIPEAKVYSNNDNTYSERFSLYHNLSRNVSSDYSLTDEHLAAFDDSLTSIEVFSVENGENYILPDSPKKVKPLYIMLLGCILNIMVLEGCKYMLRRYNLENQEWLDDLLLFQGAALIGIPRLKVSSDLVVSWSNRLIGHGITPLKVWDKNGELIKSLSFEFIHSFGIQLQMPPEQILWLIAEGEYIIFSTYVTSITIWTSKDPDACKEMPKSEHFYNGQSVISSRLLVLSYICCFKVVDFQKALYLYDVWFEDTQLNSVASCLPQPFYVNEHFYVYFKGREDETDVNPVKSTNSESIPKTSSTKDNSLILSESFHSESEINNLRPTKSYILTIYDFRIKNI